ncbi:transposase [Kitasatospora indigofera]|uniref:transposase n=1 Tax=Kitasatospora indigofera TaxID=67307 RepID=UPI0036A6F2C6
MGSGRWWSRCCRRHGWGRRGGRREKHPRRRIVDAIFCVVRTGCAWRQLPPDFPLRQRFTGTSRGGTTTAPSIASTTPCGESP